MWKDWKKQLVNGLGCDCHDENLVEVLQVKTDKRALHKCNACDTTSTRGSILRGFYIGQEAAASVIGSSIYEEIPSKISKLKTNLSIIVSTSKIRYKGIKNLEVAFNSCFNNLPSIWIPP